MIERELKIRIPEALQEFPGVYTNDPRQAGKSTLVQELSDKDQPADYVSFDDATMVGATLANLESFLRAFEQNLILDDI